MRVVGVGHGVVAVHEGFERNELSKLAAEDLWVTTKVVDHALGRLGIFCKVAHLVKAVCAGRRVHEKVWGPVQFNDNTSKSSGVAFIVLQVDVLDVRKRVLNLVTGLLVVDVVGHCALVWRVKDDEIHHVLSDSSPLADAEGSAGEVMNHFGKSVSKPCL